MFIMDIIQIASGIVENLREENRISSQALHQAQSNIKNLEKQLQEKEKIIGILEERLRVGTNSFLETNIREKDLTIKHLQLQIQKLLKQNDELEIDIIALKSDVCPRCEKKIFLGIPDEKPAPKSIKCSKLQQKEKGHKDYADRQVTLERIIEHKDKRIMHLSKEVKRLTEIEKELNNKIYRLSKLLPLSHMPSEVLTECLLKEIQLLESQLQISKENLVKNFYIEESSKVSDHFPKNIPVNSTHLSARAIKPQKKSDKSSGTAQTENGNAVASLHTLLSDINDLKHMFLAENEKLQRCLNRDSLKQDLLKVEWKEVISRLDEIAAILKNFIYRNSQVKSDDDTDHSDKNHVILRLQERLKDTLELSSEYKNENDCLREQVTDLKHELAELDNHCQGIAIQLKQQIEEKSKDTDLTNSNYCQTNDVLKLKELLNIKQTQLDDANNHLRTCQNFILELQRNLHDSRNCKRNSSPSSIVEHHSTSHSQKTREKNNNENISNSNVLPVKPQSSMLNTNGEKSALQAKEQQIKSLQTKLEVTEKNIKSLEDVIETLQNKISNLTEENYRLGTDLHLAKSERIVSEANDHVNNSLKEKLKDLKNQLELFLAEKDNLQRKIASLEEENTKLQDDLATVISENESLKDSHQIKFLLQTKLDAAEKHIDTIENSVVELQNSVESLREENIKLQSELQVYKNRFNLAKAYEEDLASLKNSLILKEEEIQKLNESLHALENKALEMNHYRRALRKELENLCNTLMEDTDSNVSTARCKAIYKAAVLRSAQALLQFDTEEVNLSDSQQSSALEEMKHQVSVYLTEVSRINELLTIKNQQREELLKEYLDENIHTNMPGAPSSHEINIHEESDVASGLESIPASCSSSISGHFTSGAKVHFAEKDVQTDKHLTADHRTMCSKHLLKETQEELSGAKSVVTYLASNCARVEDALREEQNARSRIERENEILQESIQDLKSQLKEKSSLIKRLDSLIAMLRSKECNDEIGMEQQKSEIQWLVNENQKLFEKITETQSELSKCKEENSRIHNDLNQVKRQLVNEKYDHAKVNNELRHLRQQIGSTQLTDSNV